MVITIITTPHSTGTPTDHDHVQRGRQRGQHGPVRRDIQQHRGRPAEPQRVFHQGHVLRVAQVHQLRVRAGAAPQGPRDRGFLADAQGRPEVLDRRLVRRLAGRDGRREADHGEVRESAALTKGLFFF